MKYKEFQIHSHKPLQENASPESLVNVEFDESSFETEDILIIAISYFYNIFCQLKSVQQH